MIVWRRVRRLVACLVVVAGCWEEQRVDGVFSESEWEYLQTFRLDRLAPITCSLGEARCDAIARFGQQLFFDPGYSGPLTVASDKGPVGAAGRIACVHCHDPATYFADGREDNAVSLGTAWTRRNVPSLVDLAYRKSFTWNDKYQKLEDVLELALTSPAALNVRDPGDSTLPMLSKEQRIVDHTLATYLPIYNSVFPPVAPGPQNYAPIYANLALAIATYEAKLVSGPSPFDRYLAGDTTAIDDAAKRGAKLFIGKALCSECHEGPLFADDKFHVTGVEQRGLHAPAVDQGRYEKTGNPDDDGRFRTPTLRHIAKTAPYMHAGQHETLAEVIDFYRWGGDAGGFSGKKDPRMVPLDITDDDASDLEAFLLTLTGTPVDRMWTWNPVLVPVDRTTTPGIRP